MKNKAPLALMELAVMILIFSLAAALCLQAFVWSDTTSRQNADRDRALLQAETAAEVIKACCGDFDVAAEILCGVTEPATEGSSATEGSCLAVYFDGQWQTCDAEERVFCLTAASADSGQMLLGTARIDVTEAGGEELVSLEVCWQKEAADGR